MIELIYEIMKKIFIFTMFFCVSVQVAQAKSEMCTYTTYQWNSVQKKVVNFKKVQKLYREIESYEKDKETGCTVCSEDQVELQFENIEPFQVCRKLASEIKKTLTKLLENNEPIKTVVGYRVGQTRGPLDENGNRTWFSNHSFGVALDINSELNGLYSNCETFGPDCKLVKGGIWDPKAKGALTKDSTIVKSLKQVGLKWGGESKGSLKDFMHFSPTGY